jgi:glycosyltransferase involved in cell wall biosynthesis
MTSDTPDAIDASRAPPPDLSAVVLCYRGESSIVPFLDDLYARLDTSGATFELILVANYHPDGGDRTPAVARAYAETHPGTLVVAHPKGGGMGWDMHTGFAASHGRIVIVIDGDGENAPGDVIRMFRAMGTNGADVMKGARAVREDSLYRHLLSTTYNLLFRLVFWTWDISDINAKPKGLTRTALERLTLDADDWFADAEIVLEARRAGLRIAEMPVEYHRRFDHASFVRPGAIIEFVANMLRERLR